MEKVTTGDVLERLQNTAGNVLRGTDDRPATAGLLFLAIHVIEELGAELRAVKFEVSQLARQVGAPAEPAEPAEQAAKSEGAKHRHKFVDGVCVDCGKKKAAGGRPAKATVDGVTKEDQPSEVLPAIGGAA